MQGGRRRGRQRKRWEDNIKEWTGLEWNTILHESQEPRGVEEAGCKIYSPNGQPDYRIDKIRRLFYYDNDDDDDDDD